MGGVFTLPEFQSQARVYFLETEMREAHHDEAHEAQKLLSSPQRGALLAGLPDPIRDRVGC